MIQIELGIIEADMRIRAPASEETLPVVRQALRSLGETVAADREALEDAELALTEACANVVEHAYEIGEQGLLEVTLRPGESKIDILVRDYGRGIDPRAAERTRGFGLSMIEAIAEEFEVRAAEGTELSMAFALGSGPVTGADGAIPGLEPSERVIRRLVAVVGAQIDLPTDQLMESLLVAELVARHALRHVIGERVQIGIDGGQGALELLVGPLEPGGADAIVADSEVPVVGSVVKRLVSRLETVSSTTEGADSEQLFVVIDGR